MYYRNSNWPLAADELALAVNGGKDKDGVDITPFKLSADSPRIIEYYFTYGLVLAKLNRCGEALTIAQQILSTVLPNDEVARYNASESIRLCSESAGATISPTAGTPAAPGKGTPVAPKPTVTVTPTP
jgi:hypothetical protein